MATQSTPKPVKVSRSGNSKVLPLPAELARRAAADIGDSYAVEIVGDDIIYHRTTDAASVSGTGAGRVALVPAGRPLRMSGGASVPPLDDWEF